VVVAATCLGLVDVSVAAANGCAVSPGVCAGAAVPPVAVALAVLGGLSLVVSFLLATRWIAAVLSHARDAPIEPDADGLREVTDPRRRGSDEQE